MSEIQDEEIVIPRRPTLDELFANEPFLSPTMKAKRLYGENGTEEEASPELGEVVAEALPDTSDYPVYPPREEAMPNIGGNGGMVSITAARVIMLELADGGSSIMGEPENISKLRALKDRMLLPWLRSIGSEL